MRRALLIFFAAWGLSSIYLAYRLDSLRERARADNARLEQQQRQIAESAQRLIERHNARMAETRKLLERLEKLEKERE